MNTAETVRVLLRMAGRTYAEEAGIRLADKPAPLYRLLVTSVLLSTRISADIAVAAAAELQRSGMGTPRRMRDADWQQRVDALGRARYKRYDESTATALGEGAELMRKEYRDDLRRLRERAERDPRRIRELLTGFPTARPGRGADLLPGGPGRVAGAAARAGREGARRGPGLEPARPTRLCSPSRSGRRSWPRWPRPWSGSRWTRSWQNRCGPPEL